jgi:putative transcriptional regulator
MKVWLVNHKKIKHLAQDNIVQKVEVTRQLISAIEHDANPIIKTAKRIASVLDFDWQRYYDDSNNKRISYRVILVDLTILFDKLSHIDITNSNLVKG